MNDLKGDLISRQAAIDAVMKLMPSLTAPDGSGQFDAEIFRMQEMFVDIWHVLNDMPSAQPEPLTDAEQRLFLAAMSREEKVCEEADRNYVREPYKGNLMSDKDNLMSICREIRRKVKGALWT